MRSALCSANDLSDHRRPGVVLVGADDTGGPMGLEITDRMLLQFTDVKTDGNIVPPPTLTLTVGKHVLCGREVVVVTVWRADSPRVRLRGRTWVRMEPRGAVASEQDERILNEKLRPRAPHFDVRPVPAASLRDLRVGRVEDENLPAAVDPETLAANDRTTVERLAAATMPGAYVQLLRIAGR